MRDEPQVARALTRALLEAAMYRAEAGERRGLVPAVCAEDREPQDRRHAPQPHPSPPSDRRQAEAGDALYADELKRVPVFKPSTDPAKFAERVYADVFGV